MGPLQGRGFAPDGALLYADGDALHRLPVGATAPMTLVPRGFGSVVDGSPDRRWLAYSSAPPAPAPANDPTDLYLVALDGSGPPVTLEATRVADGALYFSADSAYLTWSKNGDLLAYSLCAGGAPRLVGQGFAENSWRPVGGDRFVGWPSPDPTTGLTDVVLFAVGSGERRALGRIARGWTTPLTDGPLVPWGYGPGPYGLVLDGADGLRTMPLP
jgi:hypothetical protein